MDENPGKEKQKFTFYLPAGFQKKINAVNQNTRMSKSAVIQIALEQFFDRNPELLDSRGKGKICYLR